MAAERDWVKEPMTDLERAEKCASFFARMALSPEAKAAGPRVVDFHTQLAAEAFSDELELLLGQ